MPSIQHKLKYIHIYNVANIYLYITKLYFEGQSGKNMCQGSKPDTCKFHSSYIGMNVCGSAYENGCMVDGMYTTAAD